MSIGTGSFVPLISLQGGWVPALTDFKSPGQLAINLVDYKIYTTDGTNIIWLNAGGSGGSGGSSVSSSYATTSSFAQIAQNVLGSITSAATASYMRSASLDGPVSGTGNWYTPKTVYASGFNAGNGASTLVGGVLTTNTVSANTVTTGIVVAAQVTASSGFTGDGTYITNVISSSYATVAQNVLGSISSATSASYSLTASYAANAGNTPMSASYATTASYALTIPQFVVLAVTGSYTASSGADRWVVVNANAASSSVYFPTASLSKGMTIVVRKDDSSTHPVIAVAATTDTIDGFPGAQFIVQHDGASFTSDGGSRWMSNIVSTPENAVSASYSVTSSYALNGGSGGGGSSNNPLLTLTLPAPSAPASGTLNVYAQTIAGETLPTFQDHTGNIRQVAKSQRNTQQFRIYVTTVGLVDEMGNVLPVGTVATSTPASTSLRNNQRSIQYATANAAGGFAGFAQSTGDLQRAYGSFAITAYFSFDTWHTDGAFFVGIANTSNLLTSSSFNGARSNPSGLGTATNNICIMKDTGDTNIQVASSDFSTFTKRDTGHTVDASVLYRLTITHDSNVANSAGVELYDLTNMASLYNGILATNLPGVTSHLSFQAGVQTNSTNVNSIKFVYALTEMSFV